MTPDGKVEVGDELRTPWGETRIVEEVWRPEDIHIEGLYYKASAAEQCARLGPRRHGRQYSGTVGRLPGQPTQVERERNARKREGETS